MGASLEAGRAVGRSFLEEMKIEGYEITSSEQIMQAMHNPDLMKHTEQVALQDAGISVAVDLATLGVLRKIPGAGKLSAEISDELVDSTIGRMLAETLKERGVGAAKAETKEQLSTVIDDTPEAESNTLTAGTPLPVSTPGIG